MTDAVTVVLAGYMGCRATLAVVFFIISVGFNTFTVPGCKTSYVPIFNYLALHLPNFSNLIIRPLDFAPKYAGPIMAVSNTVANLSGFLAPLSTGHLLDVENSLQQWQLAFWVPNSFLFFYLKLNL